MKTEPSEDAPSPYTDISFMDEDTSERVSLPPLYNPVHLMISVEFMVYGLILTFGTYFDCFLYYIG